MASLVIDPWTLAMPGPRQDVKPLCRHIYRTIHVADNISVVGVVPMRAEDASNFDRVKIILNKNGEFSFTMAIQPSETGQRVLKAKSILAQFIMNDPLLLRGVSDFDVTCGETYTGFVQFNNHRVDISPFFDGKVLQTWKIVCEIIRKVSASSGQKYICSIGMLPIKGEIAYLECEDTADGHRFYELANIQKWVSEQGTSPFTRTTVSLSDINIHGHASMGMAAAPRLLKTRKSDDLSANIQKKPRTIKAKHIVCLWDCSGSMRNMVQASEEGLRQTVEEQKAIASSSGNPTSLTILSFDNNIECHVDDENILTANIDNLEEWVQPRGSTRLYDAILTATDKMKKMMGDIIFIAMTDGHDTGSETSVETVRNTMEKLKTEKNLQCIFMAANIGDAQVVGPSMGFNSATSIEFTPAAAPNAFRAASQSALRAVSGLRPAFTGVERQSSLAAPPIPHGAMGPPRRFRRATAL